jgi:hypothetical protein
MFQTKFIEKIKTQISDSTVPLPENSALYEIMWKVL